MGFGVEVTLHDYPRTGGLGPETAAHGVSNVARMRADFVKASRGIKSQLAAEPDFMRKRYRRKDTDNQHHKLLLALSGCPARVRVRRRAEQLSGEEDRRRTE
jgi:hypothetical protein